MIISHSKKFIFFHIGKTGGTTVERRLVAYHEGTKGFLSFNPAQHQVHSHQSPAYFYRSHETMVMLEQYYKFCFVRNPYDFIYSVFQQWIKTALIPPCDFNQWLTTLAFVDAFNTLSLPHITDGTRLTQGVMHLYTHFENTCLMDFIGKVEFFEYDFQKVCALLGLDYDVQIKANIYSEPIQHLPDQTRLTSQKMYKYMDRYSSDAISAVNSYFKKDFELYQYPICDPSKGSYDNPTTTPA